MEFAKLEICRILSIDIEIPMRVYFTDWYFSGVMDYGHTTWRLSHLKNEKKMRYVITKILSYVYIVPILNVSKNYWKNVLFMAFINMNTKNE